MNKVLLILAHFLINYDKFFIFYLFHKYQDINKKLAILYINYGAKSLYDNILGFY